MNGEPVMQIESIGIVGGGIMGGGIAQVFSSFRYGLASACCGGGQGVALILEAFDRRS